MPEDGFSGICSKSGDDERDYNASGQGKGDPLGRDPFPLPGTGGKGLFVLRPIV